MPVKACACGKLQPCPEHGRTAQQRARRQTPYGSILTSARWQKARKAVRARDGDRCQLEEQGECYGRLEVHHLVPVRSGGDPYDLGNLVVVCRAHHNAIETRYRAERKRRSR